MSTQVPATLTGLVERFAAVVNGTSGTCGPRLVVDGPAAEAQDARDLVYVGYGGDPADLLSATWTEDWRGLGAARKEQLIDVRCAVVCWSGDDLVAPLRAAAFVTYGLIEGAARADNTLGLASPSIAAVTAGTLIQESGRRVRLPFTVNIKTRS